MRLNLRRADILGISLLVLHFLNLLWLGVAGSKAKDPIPLTAEGVFLYSTPFLCAGILLIEILDSKTMRRSNLLGFSVICVGFILLMWLLVFQSYVETQIGIRLANEIASWQ